MSEVSDLNSQAIVLIRKELRTAVPLPVFISALIALLGKYSAYISDAVQIECNTGNSKSFTLTQVISESALFYDFQLEIQAALPEFLKHCLFVPEDLSIRWLTESESSKEWYVIKLLKSEVPGYTIEFASNELSFFNLVFKKLDEHLQVFLNSISKHPGISLGEIDYMSSHEKEKLRLLNDGPVDQQVLKPELLGDLFERTVESYPDRLAIISPLGNLTYSELNAQSERLASTLVNKGIRPGDFVGILLKRSPEVYISMLGILKAGAAYVPLDHSFPEDRIKYIIKDCNIKLLITEENIQDLLQSPAGVPVPRVLFTTQSPAYLIYTSGTTGRPKGVIISHAAVSNLIKAEDKIFQIQPDDRVLQGFSIAFDASVEEIWLAFRSGAALVPAGEDVMRSGEALSDFINENRISVLSTVATMLSMMQGLLESLRLMILGGENCPDELLQRWYRKNLRIVNTYGPTETTVIATCTDFNPNERITIGRPVINYSGYVLDKNLIPVAPGVPGELCLGGPGLASGYLNSKELTEEKFITPKFKIKGSFSNRIYRTGDLVRYNQEGNLEFLGRIDFQVKLRGYRIELGEIESQLIQFPQVKNAVVVVKEDKFKVQRLIAYIILKNTSIHFDTHACKEELRSRLASYMIPSIFIILNEFPLLSGGKVDRKKMPEPDLLQSHVELTGPKTISEKLIFDLWKKYFPSQSFSISDDFFSLGGHSLLAALVVSEMRELPAFTTVSVQDIYTFRTIENLAAYIDGKKHPQQKKENPEFKKVSKNTFIFTAALQFISLFLFYMVGFIGLLIPFIIERIWTSLQPLAVIVFSAFSIFISIPVLMLLSVILKWIVIGRFKAGHYPLWGWYYFRFWLIKNFVDLIPLGLLNGTPFLIFYFRLMGARIGEGVYLDSERIRIFDLIEIGNDSSISRESSLMGYAVRNGELIIGPIFIGSNCFVGNRSVISENSGLKDNASIGELSLLSSGQNIPENEYWKGSPALKTKEENRYTKDEQKNKTRGLARPIYFLFQSLALLFVLVFPLCLLIPFAILFYEIYIHAGPVLAMLSIIISTALYIISFCLFITIFKWIIIGKVKEEEFSIYSFRYIQKWTVDMLVSMSLTYFRSIYATVYLPAWIRSMGARIGKHTEISTVNQLNADLLDVGKGCFLADSVSIGAPVVKNKMMRIQRISIGSRTFIGNSAVISGGSEIGNDALIGVLSTPPIKKEDSKRDGTSWLGSPPIFLPQREASEKFPDELTFNPSLGIYFKRAGIEFFKITLPLIFFSSLISVYYLLMIRLLSEEGIMRLVFLAPVILFSLFLSTPFIAVLIKRILIGKYTRCSKPLWSLFVWKNELINSFCENLVYPVLVNRLLGTPFAAFFFRMMGSKIGKGVYLDTTEMTEFDLINIGDYTCLDHLCTIQTHLFEDRVMKMSDLKIGKHCNLGSMAVVLYDAVMEDHSSIASLSLVMKAEVIPAGTEWIGSPAKFAN